MSLSLEGREGEEGWGGGREAVISSEINTTSHHFRRRHLLCLRVVQH